MSLRLFSFLLLTCLFAAGCEFYPSSDADNTSDQPLVGVVWELETIENADGEVTFRPESEQTYEIVFAADGSLTAQNACNDCSGKYETTGSSLSITVSCEEAACGTPAPYLGYGDALNHATEYEIEGSNLRIRVVGREANEQTLVHVSKQE